MNLYQMTGPNDREYPPEDDWTELCRDARLEALEELTRAALIERLLDAEQAIDELRYESRYWRLRCAKETA